MRLCVLERATISNIKTLTFVMGAGNASQCDKYKIFGAVFFF